MSEKEKGGGGGSIYIGGHIYEIPPASQLTKKISGPFMTVLFENHNARISALALLLYKLHYTQSMMVLSQANILPVQVSHLVNKIKCSL